MLLPIRLIFFVAIGVIVSTLTCCCQYFWLRIEKNSTEQKHSGVREYSHNNHKEIIQPVLLCCSKIEFLVPI